MELTKEQDLAAQKIMAEMDCPKSFRCYESKFEDLCPAVVYRGAGAIQCIDGLNCSMSSAFCGDVRFCNCQLRIYVALNLGR